MTDVSSPTTFKGPSAADLRSRLTGLLTGAVELLRVHADESGDAEAVGALAIAERAIEVAEQLEGVAGIEEIEDDAEDAEPAETIDPSELDRELTRAHVAVGLLQMVFDRLAAHLDGHECEDDCVLCDAEQTANDWTTVLERISNDLGNMLVGNQAEALVPKIAAHLDSLLDPVYEVEPEPEPATAMTAVGKGR